MRFLKYIICLLLSVGCNSENDSFLELPGRSRNVNDNEKIADVYLAPADYLNWIENGKNGLLVTKTISDLNFSVFYKPYEYIVLKENEDSTLKPDELKNKINELNQMQYFTFRITAPSSSNELLKYKLLSQDEYFARVEYFSFKMQDDLKLVDGNDTLRCELFHFERIYNLAPYCTFVIGFPLSKEQITSNTQNQPYKLRDKTIVFEDKIFNSGIVKLTFESKILNHIPKLKLI